MTDPAASQPVPPPASGPAVPPQPAPPLTEAEDKQWASFAHFGGILGFLPSLIIFLVFKDRGAKTRVEAKEALNWQITWIAAAIILGIVISIINAIIWGTVSYEAILTGGYGAVAAVTGLLGFIGYLPYIANFIFSIIGGVKVNGGGSYRYPFALRLIK